MHWNWYNFLTILFLLLSSNSEDTSWLSGCCIGRSRETLPLQRQACSVSWRQEAQTLQLEFSAIVKLFWSNYEPLNEEWDCPVAGGAKSHSTWRWFQETQGPVCPGCRPMGSPSGWTSHTHTGTLRANDMNVHQGCLTFKHGYMYRRSSIHTTPWSHTHSGLVHHLVRICEAWWFSSVSH